MGDGSVNSSPSSELQQNYFVFLSFTGQDTRERFTGHLYNALCRKGICTFIDDEKLEKGEQISAALPKAIEQSRISIIIFSKNYAFSSWCLDELVKIIECKETKEQLVWPVFYDVDPSEVRHQRGSFGRAMAMHEVKFRGDQERVQKWRFALTAAANLCGWHFINGYEFMFIQRITEAVSCVQNRVPFYVAEHPVGLESRISDMGSLLGMGSDDIRMIGIHGLGGVGKTTLAKALYNEIAEQFEGASFVANVSKNSSKRGLVKLQEKFLAEIIGEKKIKLGHVDRGIPIIKDRLCWKKVLLILDDVQKSEHLEKLAGSLNWFGPGSRIIVITRDRHLLIERGVERFYEVQKLKGDESLELFSWHAFKKKTPLRDYACIAKRAVCYANGLPLALQIIGSNLCGKKTGESIAALNNYERFPPVGIQRILQISYDNLEENGKEIFLDLACFFNGEELGYVEKMLKASGFDPISGLGELVDKSLIKVEDNKVKMHDLIQHMGRAIVSQRSRLDPGKRSRLWHHEDILEVFTSDTGTNKIEGIMLELDEGQEVQWSGDAFRKMNKLRMLVVRNGVFSTGPKYLPNSLKVLEWIKYPSRSLPEDFHPTKLVVMSLPDSQLASLKPFKELINLAFMDFSGCEFLEKIPDISAVPNLTMMKLDFCWNLVEIHYSVGSLGKLVSLSARSCIKLKSLPHEVRLMSLKYLELGGFSYLESFPHALEEPENISVDRQGTGIEELPFSLGNLSKLEHLGLDYCTRLSNIPRSIGMLTNLTSISMVSCSQVIPSLIRSLDFGKLRYPLVSTLNLRQCSLPDEALPVIVFCFPNVICLNLSSNDFVVISACINELQYLQSFLVNDCILLKQIEGCPPKLALLSAANCDRLTSESTNMLGLAYQGSSARNFEAILPASIIPECCDHYFGQGQMSYWVRKSFPDIPLCLVSEMEVEEELEDCFATFGILVRINGIPLLKSSITRECYKTSNHARLIHLHSYISQCSSTELVNFKKVETCLQLEWNHVEILWKVDFFQPAEGFDLGISGPGRVHVWGNPSNTEDILFSKPPESLGSATLSHTTGNKKVKSDGSCSFETQGSVGGRKGAVYFSSIFQQQWIYDVFLSFKSEDTYHNFTLDLHNALSQRGIHTLISEQELSRGEEISSPLLKLVEQSRIPIIVFSENYAFSSRCLDELAKIMECKKTKGQLVWPIFYEVDPSDVRHLRGSFGKAMAEHEDKFRADPEKVQKWKFALHEAANLSGWHLRAGRLEYEFMFIQRITEVVTQVINRSSLHVADYPIGLEFRVSCLTCHLGIDSYGTRTVGIYGVGGIGKTTLARAMYNTMVDQFEVACFLPDIGVRPNSKRLVQLQELMLAETLEGGDIKIDNVRHGISIIKRRLGNKKVLLILDDVRTLEQLEILAGCPDWFGFGSRIIVTTRNEHLLTVHGVEIVYEMEKLNYDESLELFSWHAFKQSKPGRGYGDIAKRAVSYTNGLPLALQIIGSFLFGKQPDEQRCALDMYEKIPTRGILDILKLGFDGLEHSQKEVFLDLACFFRGEMLGYAEKFLTSCGFDAMYDIRCLIDKSLLRVENDVIKMHNLIQEMGREIVAQSSPSHPGSRLWHDADILEVLTNNAGTENIEGIMLDLNGDSKVQWRGDALKKMPNLRILIVRNALFSSGPTYFPSSLRALDWSEYPSPSLPENSHLLELLIVHLSRSRLTLIKLFEGFKCLTCMDLRESKSLTYIPDMSAIPNLRELKLDVIKVQNLIQEMGRELVRQSSPLDPSKRSRSWFHKDILEVLTNNTGAKNIEGIMLDLDGGRQLQWRGDAFKKMPKFRILIVRNALFSTGPPYNPSSLRGLEWSKYPSPHLSENSHLPELLILQLTRSRLMSFEPFKGFKCLTCMDLSESKSLTNIPDMSAIPNLMELKLDFCQNLVKIHGSVGFLIKLVMLSARQCSCLESFPQVIRLMSLQKLELGACSSLQSFPDVLEKVENIREVSLERTAIQELPYSVGKLFGLRLLKLDHCRSLRNIPSSIGMLTNLTEISMACCPKAFQSFKCKLASGKFRYSSVYRLNLQSCDVSDGDLPVIASCFPKAKYLDLSKNKFVKLSACINELRCLEKLYLANCNLLEEIEGIPPNLALLSATNCNRLTLQSTNMIALAHQKSSNKRFEVKLPGTGIPECFNYPIGEGKMSFWVRENFPDVALCLAFESEDEEQIDGSFYLECDIWVHINSHPFSQPKAYWEFRTSQYVRLVHLHSYIDDFKKVDRFEWNHVEILWEVKYHQFPLAKPGRVHIYGEETNMKDILLRKPLESHCVDTLLSLTEKGTDETVDADPGCSLPKTSHDDHIHSQQCLVAINQHNSETYGDEDEKIRRHEDKKEDISSDDMWMNDHINSIRDKKFSTTGQGNDKIMTWDPMEMEYQITSIKDQSSTSDQSNAGMTGLNQGNQWLFSLGALISSLVSLAIVSLLLSLCSSSSSP